MPTESRIKASTTETCPYCQKWISQRLIEPPGHIPGTPLKRECTECFLKDELEE